MENKKTLQQKLEKLKESKIELILVNIIIILLSLIGLINKGPIGNFLTYTFIYLFGAFYIAVFLSLIGFSIYSIVRKKTVKINFNMRLLGITLIIVSLLIATSFSQDATNPLKLNNFIQVYSNCMSSVSSRIFVIDSINNFSCTGGGFIGFFLRALLNTTIQNVGAIILYSFLLTVGVLLTLKEPIAYLISFFMNFSYKKEKKVKKTQTSVELSSNNLENINILDKRSEEVETQSENQSDFHQTITQDLPVEEKILIQDVQVNDEFSDGNDNNFFAFDEISSVTNVDKFDLDPLVESKLEINEKETINNQQEEVTNVITEPVITPVENNDNQVEEKVEEKVEEPKVEEKINLVNPFEDDNIVSIKEENTINNVETNIQIEEITQPQVVKKPKPKPYVVPSLDLLEYIVGEDVQSDNEHKAVERAERINYTFKEYGVGAQVVSYTVGPSVTRFNVKMNQGVRVNTLTNVQNEIAIALKGNKSVRIETVVEGRDTSSIEVGNDKASPVSFKELYEKVANRTSPKDALLVPFGKDIEGQVVSVSIDELPHLLVAGTTGSGKSVFVNTIIMSLLMKNNPDDLKLMLIDPKKVEFSKYNSIPHLLCPVITTTVEGTNALKKMCDLMDERYELISRQMVSKISSYNELAEKKGFEKMSNIVVIIDEYSDFVYANKQDIEASVLRLAQKARACGIYLIVCTQRPSVNIITGSIKAVIPSRVGLLVPSQVDSKTIVDEIGAESLLGYGDMLAQLPRHNSLVRLQGAYVSDLDIRNVCDFIRDQRKPEYDLRFLNLLPEAPAKEEPGASFEVPNGIEERKKDPLYPTIKEHVMKTGVASTSNLQNFFRIGYAKAEGFLMCLEDDKIIQRINNKRVVIVRSGEENNEQ